MTVRPVNLHVWLRRIGRDHEETQIAQWLLSHDLILYLFDIYGLGRVVACVLLRGHVGIVVIVELLLLLA